MSQTNSGKLQATLHGGGRLGGISATAAIQEAPRTSKILVRCQTLPHSHTRMSIAICGHNIATVTTTLPHEANVTHENAAKNSTDTLLVCTYLLSCLVLPAPPARLLLHPRLQRQGQPALRSAAPSMRCSTTPAAASACSALQYATASHSKVGHWLGYCSRCHGLYAAGDKPKPSTATQPHMQ